MTPRRIGYAAALVTVASSGYYFFLYLTRWEWNRALTSGVILLAAEIALFGALILDRVGKLARQAGRPAEPERTSPERRTLARVQAARPAPREHFAWLRPERTSVFVPVLLGAGVVVSGIAWLVERLARATAGRRMERALAVRLGALAPPGTLIAGEADPFALFTPGAGGPDARDGS